MPTSLQCTCIFLHIFRPPLPTFIYIEPSTDPPILPLGGSYIAIRVPGSQMYNLRYSYIRPATRAQMAYIHVSGTGVGFCIAPEHRLIVRGVRGWLDKPRVDGGRLINASYTRLNESTRQL